MKYINNSYSVAIYTLGCRVNQYESDAIAEYLAKEDVRVRPFTEKCDFYIINTCAVTAESERKSRQMIRRAKSRNKDAKIFVIGCKSQLDYSDILGESSVIYIGGNTKKLDVAYAVLKAIHDIEANQEIGLDNYTGSNITLNIEDIDSSEFENYQVKTHFNIRAYIKIEDGCNNQCAYCIIPKVRGRVRSKPFADVIQEAKNLVENGTKEIVLTGIEICSYQYDLVLLMQKLAKIDGLQRIRLSSLNPLFITKDFVDKISNCEKICPHFHLSLQSCCDKTLASMGRRYKVQQVKENLEYMRSYIKNVTFSADIICGFPGESDVDFNINLENFEALKMLNAHIFPYSVRKGTAAAEMEDQVSKETKTFRAAKMAEVALQGKNKIVQHFIDEKTVFSVLFERYKDGMLYGHTENFIEVCAKGDKSLVGEIVSVLLVFGASNVEAMII